MAFPMTVAPPDFEAIHNFRDFGGYASSHGGHVKRGRLFRSAHYADATDTDLDRFAKLGMSSIVDLRRPAERVKYPSRRAPGCAARVVAYGAPSDQADPPHAHSLADPHLTTQMIHDHMVEVYRDLAHEDGHVQVFGDAFHALADTGGPIVVHCHAGKDRTGLLVMLIQHALGVAQDDIVSDYLATNEKSRIAQRLPQLMADYEANNGIKPREELMAFVWRVERPYLDETLKAITERDGSLDGYIENRLKVSPALRARLRDMLIERG